MASDADDRAVLGDESLDREPLAQLHAGGHGTSDQDVVEDGAPRAVAGGVAAVGQGVPGW